MLIVVCQSSGCSINGSAFHKCTDERKHTNHNGTIGGMELIIHGLQLACFDSLCPSTIEVTCTHSTIRHGGEMLLLNEFCGFGAAANNILSLNHILVKWEENKSPWYRN